LVNWIKWVPMSKKKVFSVFVFGRPIFGTKYHLFGTKRPFVDVLFVFFKQKTTLEPRFTQGERQHFVAHAINSGQISNLEM
jgi:hypothetical protein